MHTMLKTRKRCGRPDGHRGQHLSVATVERQRKQPKKAARVARRLELGEQILSASRHHTAMAVLKAQLGDPRPAGLELSLVDPWGPGSYWGHTYQNGKRVPYRLSVRPEAYVWETHDKNMARGRPTADVQIDEVMADLKAERLATNIQMISKAVDFEQLSIETGEQLKRLIRDDGRDLSLWACKQLIQDHIRQRTRQEQAEERAKRKEYPEYEEILELLADHPNALADGWYSDELEDPDADDEDNYERQQDLLLDA